jgi:peptidoglycan/xylan/chitin deacetylase (PgdA/CDA1 family)
VVDRTTPAILAAAAALTAAGAFALTRFTPTAGTSPAPKATPAPQLALPYGPAERLQSAVAAPAESLHAGDAGGAGVYAVGGAAPSDALRLLTAAGIPAAPAATPADAFRRPVAVWLGPLGPPDQAAATQFVTRGGVLLVFGASPGAAALAGASLETSATRTAVQVLAGGGVPATQLRLTPFAGAGWGRAAGVLARYDATSAAWVVRRLGAGVVALSGIPLASLAAPAGADTRDLAVAVVRALYQLSPSGVTLGAAPEGNLSALVLTHDLDSPGAYAGAAQVAQIEADRGVRSTFFAVTRTAESGPHPLLTLTTAALLRGLRQRGFDIAAGGVAPRPFAALPQGSGSEAFPTYAPPPGGNGSTRDGEVRVSTHVIRAVTGSAPVAFRPPALLTPADAGPLDTVLAGAGIPVESAVMAAASGGGLPFRAPAPDGQEYPVLRLPVAFDDRAGPRVDTRNGEIVQLLNHAAATAAPAVVRLSPAAGSAATFAEQQLLAELPPATWVGSAADYAAFWSARYAITMAIRTGGDGITITLTASGAVPSQTLIAPFPVATAVLQPAGTPLPVSSDGRRVTVPAFTGTTDVALAAGG